jgi:hypothetical protein
MHRTTMELHYARTALKFERAVHSVVVALQLTRCDPLSCL